MKNPKLLCFLVFCWALSKLNPLCLAQAHHVALMGGYNFPVHELGLTHRPTASAMLNYTNFSQAIPWTASVGYMRFSPHEPIYYFWTDQSRLEYGTYAISDFRIIPVSLGGRYYFELGSTSKAGQRIRMKKNHAKMFKNFSGPRNVRSPRSKGGGEAPSSLSLFVGFEGGMYFINYSGHLHIPGWRSTSIQSDNVKGALSPYVGLNIPFSNEMGIVFQSGATFMFKLADEQAGGGSITLNPYENKRFFFGNVGVYKNF